MPIALADYLAGLFGALGATTALLERERNHQGGQWVDVSLYESVFRLLEAVVPAYGKNGKVRERNGNRTGQSSPIGSYPTSDESVHGAQRVHRPCLAPDDRGHGASRVGIGPAVRQQPAAHGACRRGRRHGCRVVL